MTPQNTGFGLLEIKCPNVKSCVDCPYLKLQNGTPELKQQHAYYCQVQGQMLISGLDWCDLVVYAQDDMKIQRIYKDMFRETLYLHYFDAYISGALYKLYQRYLYLHVYRNSVSKLFIFSCLEKQCIKVIYMHFTSCISYLHVYIATLKLLKCLH